MEKVQEIMHMLPDGERLAQLAEEAAELAQAALKLRRVLDGTNVTPVAYQTAVDNLVEEVSDVALCVEVCGLKADEHIMSEKLERWLKRLETMPNPDTAEVCCETCKHEYIPGKPCEAADYDCMTCDWEKCICTQCHGGSKWERRATDG